MKGDSRLPHIEGAVTSATSSTFVAVVTANLIARLYDVSRKA
jgi:hypothetical protein